MQAQWCCLIIYQCVRNVLSFPCSGNCFMNAAFFAIQSEFREWLQLNHQSHVELLIGFYKVGSGKPSMTWPQSVDEALCFGWIDGVRRRIDDVSYSVRFTPRKATSIWSSVNVGKVELLTQNGLMRPAGIEAFAKRVESKSGIYAYENEPAQLSTDFEQMFKANKKAWEFFATQAPSYQNTIIHWIIRAKQDITRLSRLEKTIAASEGQKRLA